MTIHASQAKSRETSRGRTLVIVERLGHPYEWTVYADGIDVDSGASPTLPHAAMLRERWTRIDLLRPAADGQSSVVSLRLA